jgi:hypothetical protein
MEDLYRARFDGKVPHVSVQGGTVTVRYRPALRPPRGQITLSGRVPWAIRAHMGMSDVVADLEVLQLTDFEISGGTSKLTVRLSRPKDAVRVRIGAGASNVDLVGRPASLSGSASGAAPRRWPSTTPASTLPEARPTGEAPTTTRPRAATTSRSVPEPARSPSEPENTTAGPRDVFAHPAGLPTLQVVSLRLGVLSCAGQFKVRVFADLDAYADLDVYAADVDDELRAAAVAARRASGRAPRHPEVGGHRPGRKARQVRGGRPGR